METLLYQPDVELLTEKATGPENYLAMVFRQVGSTGNSIHSAKESWRYSSSEELLPT